MKTKGVIISLTVGLGLTLALLWALAVEPVPLANADATSGTRIQLPALDTDTEGGWETRIQVQNVGDEGTWAVVIYWGAYWGLCPPDDPGPLTTWDKQWLPLNGVWTVTPTDTARSAIVLSFAAEPTAQPDETTLPTGEPLAVTVKRTGPGDADPDASVTSAYNGLSEDMEGAGPPYKYFAPHIMYGHNGLTSTITIQNSGDQCTPVWIYYKEEGNCELQVAQHIEDLAPGEAVRVGPGGDIPFPGTLPPEWQLGSAYISALVPLGIIVDQVGNDMLMTHAGVPYEDASSLVNYAPLIFREYNGWETNITVQNLTTESVCAEVKVDFLDNSGNIINTVVDWVCWTGSKTFTLPVVDDLTGTTWGRRGWSRRITMTTALMLARKIFSLW